MRLHYLDSSTQLPDRAEFDLEKLSSMLLFPALLAYTRYTPPIALSWPMIYLRSRGLAWGVYIMRIL